MTENAPENTEPTTPDPEVEPTDPDTPPIFHDPDTEDAPAPAEPPEHLEPEEDDKA